MKKDWWKWLAMALVLGSMIFGMITPVGPGIEKVSQQQILSGQTLELGVTGYNTHFDQGENAVFLIKDSFYIPANQVQVESHNQLQAQFTIPCCLNKSFVNTAYKLAIKNPTDGLFIKQEAVVISDDEMPMDSAQWLLLLAQNDKIGYAGAKYFNFPYRITLYESIRNLNFHVPMWFSMITMLFISFFNSILYLSKRDRNLDLKANALVQTGVFFGIAGIATGAFWAKFTWGDFWSPDPKLNGAAIGLLIYLGYLIVRRAIDNEDVRGRISAVFNLLAFPIFIVLIIVLPKLANSSLHPGSGDSVGFNQYDLNNNLRMVFYPAVLGWILLGSWLSQINFRIQKIKHEKG